MVRGIEKIEEKRNRKKGLMEEKDYITEAWLQGGKAVGEMIKGKRKLRKKK